YLLAAEAVMKLPPRTPEAEREPSPAPQFTFQLSPMPPPDLHSVKQRVPISVVPPSLSVSPALPLSRDVTPFVAMPEPSSRAPSPGFASSEPTTLPGVGAVTP